MKGSKRRAEQVYNSLVFYYGVCITYYAGSVRRTPVLALQSFFGPYLPSGKLLICLLTYHHLYPQHAPPSQQLSPKGQHHPFPQDPHPGSQKSLARLFSRPRIACACTPGWAGVSGTVSSALAWLKTVASKKTRAVRRYIAGVVSRRVPRSLGPAVAEFLVGFYTAR